MTGTYVKTLRTFAGLCGREVMKNVVFATTMWDILPSGKACERQAELKDYWLKDLVKEGGKVEISRGNDIESAWQIINHVLKQTPCASLQGPIAAVAAAQRRGLFSRVFGKKS